MKLSTLKFISAITVAIMQAATSAQVTNSYELKDDEIVVVKKADDKTLPARFNYDRHFLISINVGIPGAIDIKSELIKLISSNGALDKVLFESFGSENPTNVEVGIGKRVPVEIAQTVIRTLTTGRNLPIRMYVYKDDSINQDNRRLFFGYTQRIIIGSLDKRKGKPLSKEQTEALLREGIAHKEFLKLLSESK